MSKRAMLILNIVAVNLWAMDVVTAMSAGSLWAILFFGATIFHSFVIYNMATRESVTAKV